MQIGPVVEGRSEERAIPKLLDKLQVRYRPPLVADGKQDLLRRARDYAQMQLDKGASFVLFCFDSDGPDGERDINTLRQGLPGIPIWGYVPVHALEAWLLADESALGSVLGRPVDRVSRPEEEPRPAAVLDRIFRAAGRSEGYLKTRHAAEIAKLSSDRALLRCPSYERSSTPFRK